MINFEPIMILRLSNIGLTNLQYISPVFAIIKETAHIYDQNLTCLVICTFISFWPPFPPFYPKLRLFYLTSHNSSSQNIGETDAWAVPPPQILGSFPQSPLSLHLTTIQRFTLRLLYWSPGGQYPGELSFGNVWRS